MQSINFLNVDWKSAYYCRTCQLFYDEKTETHFDVPYESMPADIAILVMEWRNGVLKRHPPTNTEHKRKKKRPKNGF